MNTHLQQEHFFDQDLLCCIVNSIPAKDEEALYEIKMLFWGIISRLKGLYSERGYTNRFSPKVSACFFMECKIESIIDLYLQCKETFPDNCPESHCAYSLREHSLSIKHFQKPPPALGGPSIKKE